MIINLLVSKTNYTLFKPIKATFFTKGNSKKTNKYIINIFPGYEFEVNH
jgi:hypothetical protein